MAESFPGNNSGPVECSLSLRIDMEKGSASPIRNLGVTGTLTPKGLTLETDPVLPFEFPGVARFRVERERVTLHGISGGRVLRVTMRPEGAAGNEEWLRFCVLGALRVCGLSASGRPMMTGIDRDSIAAHGRDAEQALEEIAAGHPDSPLVRLWQARLHLANGRGLSALERLRPADCRKDPEGRLVAALSAVTAGKPLLAEALTWPEKSVPERLFLQWLGLRERNVAGRIRGPGGEPAGEEVFPGLDGPPGWADDLPWPESERRFLPPNDALFEGWMAWTAGDPGAGEIALERYRYLPGANPTEVIRLEAALAVMRGDLEHAWRLMMMAALPGFFRTRALLALRLERESETLAAPGGGVPPQPDPDESWLLAALHHGAGRTSDAARLVGLTGDHDAPAGICPALLRGEIALIEGEIDRAAELERRAGNVLAERQAPPAFHLRRHLLSAGIALRRKQPREAMIELALATGFARPSGSDRLAARLADLRETARSMLAEEEAALVSPGQSHVLSNLHRLVTRVSRATGLADLADRARRILEDSRQPLLLAVMGECKAGKSTLINAFLGEDRLPTGSVPTTEVPWILKPGAQEVALLHGRGGELQVTTSARVADEARGVGFPLSRVEWYLPSLRLRDLALVDTPGLNSLYEAHQDASENFLEHADAILWVFDATQIGRASEREVLRTLLPGNCPVLLLLNRADEIDPEELPELLAQAVDLAGSGNGRGSAVAVSARKARAARCANDPRGLAESGFPALEERLKRELGERSWIVKEGRLSERARQVQEIVRKRRETEIGGLDVLREAGERLLEKIDGWPDDWRLTFAPLLHEAYRQARQSEETAAAALRESRDWSGIRSIDGGAGLASALPGELKKGIETWIGSRVEGIFSFWGEIVKAGVAPDRAMKTGVFRGRIEEIQRRLEAFLQSGRESELAEPLKQFVGQICDLSAAGTREALLQLAALRATRDLLWYEPILELRFS